METHIFDRNCGVIGPNAVHDTNNNIRGSGSTSGNKETKHEEKNGDVDDGMIIMAIALQKQDELEKRRIRRGGDPPMEEDSPMQVPTPGRRSPWASPTQQQLMQHAAMSMFHRLNQAESPNTKKRREDDVPAFRLHQTDSL